MDVAGTVFAVVSLSIQLADGARKGFDLFESAYHADEECKAFAVSIAIEHDRFERWAEACGLIKVLRAQAGDEDAEDGDVQRNNYRDGNADMAFERYIRFNSDVVIRLLSEIHLIMGQLSGSEARYSKFINFDDDTARNNPVQESEPDGLAVSQVVDITEPIKPLPVPESVRNTKAKLLSGFITSRTPPRKPDLKPRSGTNTPTALRNPILSRLAKSTKVLTEPKRLRWAFRDREGANAKIKRVHYLNSALQESLGHSQMQVLIEGNELFKAMLIQVLGAVDEMKGTFHNLRAIQSVDQMEPDAQRSDDSASTWTGPTLVDGRDGLVTRSRGPRARNQDFMGQAAGFMLAVLDRSATATPRNLSQQDRAMMLEGTPFDDGLRMAVTLPGERYVWVEWKPYNLVNVPSPSGADYRVSPDTIAKMDRLVSLLQVEPKPVEFCVPPCLGYFVDELEERFGVVYERPKGVIDTQPRSLSSAFKLDRMPLSCRVRIAQRLGQWLFHLHSVRWLHKSICSSSIIFFSEEGSRALGDPFITGFSYARSAAGTTVQMKRPDDGPGLLYVHPHYLGARAAQGFRKIYDIYSLGIVLIELAFWKPIQEILGYVDDSAHPQETGEAAHGDGSRTTTRQDNTTNGVAPKASEITGDDVADIRTEMLNGSRDVLEQVRSLAGDKYHDAVKACIQGMEAFGLSEQDPEADTAMSADLLEAFNTVVVEPLRSIAV